MDLKEMNLQQVEERLTALDIEVRSFTEVADVEKATEEKKGCLSARPNWLTWSSAKDRAGTERGQRRPKKSLRQGRKKRKWKLRRCWIIPARNTAAHG